MRRLALALLVVVGAACAGGEGATAPPTPPSAPPSTPPAPAAAVVGTYVLQTMNGAAVPGVYFLAESYRFDVTSGTFDLRTDRTYRIALTMRYVGVDGVVESPEQEFEQGTYTLSGPVLTLRSDAGVTMSASLAGAQITMRMDGLNFMYRKP